MFKLIFLFLFPLSIFATEGFEFAPKISTNAPLFIGAGGTITYQDNLQFNFQYGMTPTTYYNQIAKLSAHYGNNPKYENVVNAAFSSNKIFKADLQYNFSGKSGWKIGMSGYVLSASGQAGIDEVLGATTGKDYTTLKNLLHALGKSTDVSLDSSLKLFEIYGGYGWDLGKSFYLEGFLGVTKVFDSTEHISTGLPNYEASASGSSTLRSTEEQLQSIIKDNGFSPTLGITVSYFF